MDLPILQLPGLMADQCLSKYRLKDLAEFKELMLNEEFSEYAYNVYQFLDRMAENSVFRFAEKCNDPQKLIWFIKIACWFVTTECHIEYDINESFTAIRRRKVDKWDIELKIKYFRKLRKK